MSRPLNAAAVNEIVSPVLTNASISQDTHKAIKPLQKPNDADSPWAESFCGFSFIVWLLVFSGVCACLHPSLPCKVQKPKRFTHHRAGTGKEKKAQSKFRHAAVTILGATR